VGSGQRAAFFFFGYFVFVKFVYAYRMDAVTIVGTMIEMIELNGVFAWRLFGCRELGRFHRRGSLDIRST